MLERHHVEEVVVVEEEEVGYADGFRCASLR